MAEFQDSSKITWVHELANSELHPDGDRLLSLGQSSDPHQAVEEATLKFLSELRDQFTEAMRVFNGYSDTGKKFQEIKIYSLAQTAADFMVYRNQIKLVVSNSAHGVIQFEFLEHLRAGDSISGTPHGTSNGSGNKKSAELLAHVGPFHDVEWTFQGAKITAEQVARYYFTEFVRTTRDSKKLRPNNQALLDQIRLLLQEKGLEL